MKKLKVCLVSLLAMLTVLFCFAGCFGSVAGVYKVTDYRVASTHTDVPENNSSYIEIKDDNTVVIDISLANGMFTKKETGTLVELEEKNTYEIQIKEDDVTIFYEASLKNGALVVEIPFAFATVTIIAEKQ